MPDKIIKDYAKKTDKSKREIEKLWKKAVKIADEMGQSGNYAYIQGIVQNMLDLDESVSKRMVKNYFLEKYLESGKPFNKFIEDITSVDFSVRPENPPETDEDGTLDDNDKIKVVTDIDTDQKPEIKKVEIEDTDLEEESEFETDRPLNQIELADMTPEEQDLDDYLLTKKNQKTKPDYLSKGKYKGIF